MGNKSPLLALQTNSWKENGNEVNNALRLCELIKLNLALHFNTFLKGMN